MSDALVAHVLQDFRGEGPEAFQHQGQVTGVPGSIAVCQEPQSQRAEEVCDAGASSHCSVCYIKPPIPSFYVFIYDNNLLIYLLRDTERNKEIGFLEAQVYEYVEILGVSDFWLTLLLWCNSMWGSTFGHWLLDSY